MCESKKCAIKIADVLFKRSNNSWTNKTTTIQLRNGENGSEDKELFKQAKNALKVTDYLKERLAVYGIVLKIINVRKRLRASAEGGSFEFVLEQSDI